jgi:hypothetical protein
VSDYADFLTAKAQRADGDGFEPTWVPEWLFPFQAQLVTWAVRQGRAALFADCGLGKTPQQLVWAENVRRHTGKPVLIVAPLAVTFQTRGEAHKFGLDADISRDGTVTAPLTITNYDRLEHFRPEDFGGVVCDESSAIKAFDGTRRAIVTEFLRTLPYRLLATATAAPNDYTELGTSSEALGQLGHVDMLNRYFVNERQTSDTKVRRGRHQGAFEGQGWRFKGHAEDPFWRWVAGWARAVRRPSDLGFADDGFVLPELIHQQHIVTAGAVRDEEALFDLPAIGLTEERREIRNTITERCEAAAGLLADADHAVAWCHLNDESALLTKLIDGAVEVSGSDSPDEKEEKLAAFTDGQIRVLVTKPVIGAWGLNWQHCNRTTYFPSHSYEQYYQAVRRFWRFGQTRPVTVDIVGSEGSERVMESLARKAAAAELMFDRLVAHMNDAIRLDLSPTPQREVEVPAWLAS